MINGEEKQEIIIVKRVSGGGDGHHGGAWKIAFADFMTAMMALFLVLWLVNAANEKTKKSVASYFNPVKLIDRTRSSKGLDESTSADTPKSSGEKRSSSDSAGSGEPEESQNQLKDDEFFKDPFAVMDDIVTEELERIENAELAFDRPRVVSAPADDPFLDPFAHAVRKPDQDLTEPQQTEVVEAETDDVVDGVAATFEELAMKSLDQQTVVSETVPKPGHGMLDTQGNARKQISKDKTEGLESKVALKTPPGKSLTAVEGKTDKTQQVTKTADDKKLEQMSAEILKDIRKRLTDKLGLQESISESLTVRATDEGILISITDQFGFSMFQVGSAVPKGEIVLAMSEISKVLSQRQGKVRIYGHTDSRPYAGHDYDNWRLSTSRAHAARLMLARGGLEEDRVSQVVGFADRVLRLPELPESDANRRIEILLEIS